MSWLRRSTQAMRDLQPGEEGEVLSCSSPAMILLLLSYVEIFGNSFLYPEAIFLHAVSIMRYRLYTAALELLQTI
jgi:hypothetical protein